MRWIIRPGSGQIVVPTCDRLAAGRVLLALIACQNHREHSGGKQFALRNEMRNASEALEFAGYLWRRRILMAITCVTALAVAGVVSLLLPARYTATASILIEPPGGNDPRAATAVSTVYLESLKTYERFASNDTLFEHALDDLRLRQRYPGASTEVLKRRILEVSKPVPAPRLSISAPPWAIPRTPKHLRNTSQNAPSR